MSALGRGAAEAHERRVARRIEARGLPGLGEALAALRGTRIHTRWEVESLYAVGAEGAVYLLRDVEDGSRTRVAKIALVPYHRPADLSSSVLRARREALRTEERHLDRSASPYMPESHGLVEFVNPLLDRRRGGAFAEPEPALVMERLPGFDMDVWLARIHRSGIAREALRPHLDRVAVVLLQALHDLQERGFHYADLRPGNLRVIGRPVRRIRLLDAGSLVELSDASGRFPHVPHYLPPDAFARLYTQGAPIVPTPAVQAIMAGRTLFEVGTGRLPVPGEPVDAAALRDCALSPVVADVVDGLATGSFTSVIQALRYLTRRVAQTRAAAPARAAPERAALELEAPAPRAAQPAPALTPAPAPVPVAPPSPPARLPAWRRLLGWLLRRGPSGAIPPLR